MDYFLESEMACQNCGFDGCNGSDCHDEPDYEWEGPEADCDKCGKLNILAECDGQMECTACHIVHTTPRESGWLFEDLNDLPF